MLNERNRLLVAMENKLEEQISQEVRTLEEIEMEKNRFLDDYSRKVKEFNHKNECLMDEIAQLNEDLYQLEMVKNKEIEKTKDNYTREHKTQLENILTNHSQTI